MAVKFNPFTGQLQIDEKGSGGGSSYIDGEVQNFSALPQTLGSPAIDSAYLVREAEGAWLISRKPAGIYIRTANTGVRASDWTYAGEFPDVFNDANFVLYDDADSTKNAKFQLSGIATGTTRTITVPDNDVTLPDQGTSTTDTPSFAGATINQIGTWGLTVASGATETNTADFTGDSTNYNLIRVQNTDGGSSFYMACTGSGYSGSNFGESNAGQVSLEVNGGGTNNVGLIGNRYGSLGLGANDKIQLRLDSNGTTISDPTDITKKVRLSAASVTAGQTRIATFPDKNITLDDAGDARTPTSHNHNASDINAGTLTHERGGLEADVSAYSGLVKISGGATSAVTVTATGESVIGAADAAAARSAISAAAASHTHGTGDITGLAASATTDTTNANNITSGTLGIARIPTGSTSTTVAVGNHSHELTALAATGATNGHVLTANGSGGVTFAAASGGISGSLGSTANVVPRTSGTGGGTLQDSAIIIDDAATGTQNNVSIRNNHSQTNSALVLCNKGTGGFIVSPARPDGTSTGGNARGSGAICIQTSRTAATQVASTTDSIAIGNRSTSSSSLGESVAIGAASSATGSYATVVGARATGTATYTCAFGHDADATISGAIAIGDRTTSSSSGSIIIGSQGTASGDRAISIGEQSSATGAYSVAMGFFAAAPLRGQFLCYPFSAVYWAGTTTNNTPTVLSLDGTAGNRFTIAANTALAVDILLVARRSDAAGKLLVARRFLGIRRDGSNNTALIGAVQTLGTDQNEGSPTWTFALTADNGNEALQLEVTGATGETVVWRAMAFYRGSF